MALIAENQDLVQAAARGRRPLVIWLSVVLLMILGLVAVGGITRLTESGLSMVDWKPLLGVMPPTSEEAWEARFDQYKAYPEYQMLRPDMSLAEFKQIFFWEYLHRLLARGVGVVYLLPFLYFLARRRLEKGLAIKLAVGFLLGGLQGLMGWYMVKSGLVDRPHVSHFRLAAHLSLAFLLFAYLLWVLLDLLPTRHPPPRSLAQRQFRNTVVGFLAILVVQIIYGAFVAGLNAGYMFNTWPRMLGRWIPPGMHEIEPVWQNWISNPTTIQFGHRWLAVLVLLSALALWAWAARPGFTPRQKLAARLVGLLTLVQVLVGIITLVLVVPVTWATIHQVLACLLLGATVFLLHASKTLPAKSM